MTLEEAREYKIETISDFVALTPEQRERCMKDLLAFALLCDLAREMGMQYVPVMTWIDDGRHDIYVREATE